jgi:hypothetical protein
MSYPITSLRARITASTHPHIHTSTHPHIHKFKVNILKFPNRDYFPEEFSSSVKVFYC